MKKIKLMTLKQEINLVKRAVIKRGTKLTAEINTIFLILRKSLLACFILCNTFYTRAKIFLFHHLVL